MSDSDITFESLFDGKRDKLERKLTVDGSLLSKLQDYRIITESQRSTIEVTAVTVCMFFFIESRDVKRASINRCLNLKAMIDFASS